MSSEESLSVEQLNVERHIKLKSPMGKIDVHCSGTVCGAWLTAGKTSAAVYVERDQTAVICLYPNQGGLPFAVTKHGIQLPTENHKERPVILPWDKIKEIAAKFKQS